ncbi:gluconate 2-dehydrogenase subunit 3 family protein [Roseicella frigidaeris]|uniref:Gluconate 2-dehydrogenase subunit 3 family protein n=1 Tax=Roseicella frigidaeris TaxID=2230885 RepID=A0A327M485_9PROT|nr:gluconate 2-dehydrogenase subunit 3 family protein [Roseicella frigidaeris]RAI57022.1 gluconate 2-dehydrogenase subunit 3 family protein [Roseicella frigidaeris]
MRQIDKRAAVRRRVFLRGAATGPAALAAAGFALGAEAAWAGDLRVLTPATMATLARAARDIFPHDRLADRYYIAAVLPYDDKAASDKVLRALIEEGAARLDAEAQARHGRAYVQLVGEADRVAILQALEATPFFARLRGDLVVSLYNQKEVWPVFGYEGASYDKGGYIERGFNDIDWLPEA